MVLKSPDGEWTIPYTFTFTFFYNLKAELNSVAQTYTTYEELSGSEYDAEP